MTKMTYNKYRYPGVRRGKKAGTFLIDYMDHQGKRHQQVYHGSESDAAKVRRQILAKVDRIKAGIESPPEAKKVQSFGDLWEHFWNDRLMKVRSGTMVMTSLERNRNSIDAILGYDPSLKNAPLDQIDYADIEAFKTYRTEMGRSPTGVNTDLRSLRTIFNFAVRKGYIEKSPLAEVASVAERRRDVRFLDEDELRSLYLVMEQLDLENPFQRDARDLFLFYLYTGARTSEALYPLLTWQCVGKDSITFPSTKGHKSRKIPMSETVNSVLDGRREIDEGPFHFTRDMVYNRVKYLMEEADIPEASTHTLRKTAGAWYYMATRDIFATSRFLGHSSVKVTEQHYAGLIQSLQVEYSAAFERRLQLGCNFETKPDQSRPNRRHLRHKKSPNPSSEIGALARAGPTGIEPATSGLTGRRSNQTELRSQRTGQS